MILKSKDHKEQLLKWLNGTSTHCYFGYGKEDYECCPDFSCCHPALMRPRDERQRYVDADKGERHRMLATFLEAFLNRAQKKVSVEH
jgi:hypothetical protein